MSNSKLNIDAGIDLYFYGKYFRYDRKPDAVYVYPNPGTSYPGIPVEDWMEGHTVMNPSKLRAFAKYFYDRGKESYRVTITGEELAGGRRTSAEKEGLIWK